MQKGRKIGHPGVADMSAVPDDEPYQPPQDGVRHMGWDVQLQSQSVHIEQTLYRERPDGPQLIVDFVINQIHPAAVHSNKTIVRYDCCHSRIHKHHYNKAGHDMLGSRTYAHIPPSPEGCLVTNRWFKPCYRDVEQHAEEYVRRWRRS